MTTFDAQAGRAMPPDQGLSRTQVDADDDDVATALAHLAHLVSDVDDLQDVLAQIADFTLAAIPGADATGITLVRSSAETPAVLAWSVTSDVVRELDHLQYEVCREGPCMTALQTQRPLVSGSLGSDSRWPRFGGRAARLSVHSALAIPLLVRGTSVGAINVYARQRDAFTEHAVTLSERFAGPAAICVHNLNKLQAARDHAAHLQIALGSRSVIDQAIGIIRSRSGTSAQEAFGRLRQTSQAENLKLSLVAERLIDEAVRRAYALRR